MTDRVPSHFFAGHNLVRYAAQLHYPAHSCQPAKTEAQFFSWKPCFKERYCALCLLALLSHLADETTSGFHAVYHLIQTVNSLYEEVSVCAATLSARGLRGGYSYWPDAKRGIGQMICPNCLCIFDSPDGDVTCPACGYPEKR